MEEGYVTCPMPVVTRDREPEEPPLVLAPCEGVLSVTFEGRSVPYRYGQGSPWEGIAADEPEFPVWRVVCEMGHVLVVGYDEDRPVPFAPDLVDRAVEVLRAPASEAAR